MLGQPLFNVTNCDFVGLGIGVYGALFYGGYKLTGVKNCKFDNCDFGIATTGAGAHILTNTFFNTNNVAISIFDNTLNSSIKTNTITSNWQLPIIYNHYDANAWGFSYRTGILVSSGFVDIVENKINNVQTAVENDYGNMMLKCNDLQNNSYGLFSFVNTKVNMSADLGGGYNNAANCQQFALFDRAYSFEANNGYNNFSILDASPCYSVMGVPHNILKQKCPTIMAGNLLNYTLQEPMDPITANAVANNYWRAAVSSPDAPIEEKYNKFLTTDDLNNFGADYEDNNLLMKDRKGHVITAQALQDNTLVTCPIEAGGGGGGVFSVAATSLIGNTLLAHPLSAAGISSKITTPAFNNVKMQAAVKTTLVKMGDVQAATTATNTNQAADLFTQILKVNYPTPIKNSDDRYLLDLSYQKLMSNVATLTEVNKTSSTPSVIPLALKNRYANLHAIVALRLSRKDATDKDAKVMKDLIKLDDAMIYRLEEKRPNAIAVINSILATNPEVAYRKMYEHLVCMWSTEEEAIKNAISVTVALDRIRACNALLKSNGGSTTTSGQRLGALASEKDIAYATDYSIAVYPNPTSGHITISYNLQDYTAITFEVVDVQGKKVFASTLNSKNDTFNSANLNLDNGIYFYTITGNGKNLMTKKLVIAK
jgi:Secretion system C-terminal sorting domain